MKNNANKKVVLAGYSGHALVAAEALMLAGYEVAGYLEKEPVKNKFLDMHYFGFEKNKDVLENIRGMYIFPAIGDNSIRKKLIKYFEEMGFEMATAIHPGASVSKFSTAGSGTLVCRGALINPIVNIGKGVIINTGAIIEHECIVEDFAHIAPGAVLAGRVKIGEGSFIGANAVIKQNVKVGKDATIGAGAVVLHDTGNGKTYVGNPARILSR
jgi:sugar O-acyltransferase (sialic acid O-acetyltransferase NeuD family)